MFFDSEGEKREDAGFDAVVGNPPYVEVDGAIEQYLRSNYEVTEYFVDLFHAFTERGIDLSNGGGEYGYILPAPWLTIENREKLRRYVLNNSNVQQITRVDRKVFAEATVDSIIIIGTLEDREEVIDIRKIDSTRISNTEIQVKLDQEDILNTESARIEIEQTEQAKEILAKIRAVSVELESIADLAIGVQAYNSSKHTKEQIENRVFHSTEKESEEYLPEIAGNDVSRYDLEFDGNSWLRYGDHLHDCRDMYYLQGPRILVRQIPGSEKYKIHATYTEDTYCNYNTILNIKMKDPYDHLYVLSVLNSSLMSWVFPKTANSVVTDSFPKLSVVDLKKLPIREITQSKKAVESPSADSLLSSKEQESVFSNCSSLEKAKVLAELADERLQLERSRKFLNTSLVSYISDDKAEIGVSDIGLLQPVDGVSRSIISGSSKSRLNLRIGSARVTRESSNTVLVEATARYKPENPDNYETDRWGYTETDFEPAFRITDLTEREADLIEHFVPVAVDEAGGFANFRETATKTISPLDRLKAIELPAINEVADDLENYLRTKERAEELDEKIEKTDELIDEIVYELYGLTEEEIEIVEEAVGGE